MSRVVLGCWLYRGVACGLVATPWSLAVGSQMVHVPAGDAALWGPGGVWLTEVARWLETSWWAPVKQGGLLGLILGVGWWMMVGALAGECAGHRRPFAAAWQRLGSLLFLAGAGSLLQAVVVVAAGLAWLRWQEGWWLVALAVGAWSMVVHVYVDVARVARFHGDTWNALHIAWEQLSAGARLWWAGAWRWVLAVASLAVSLGGAYDVAASTGSLVGTAVLPALGLLGWTVLRASWLRAVHRAVAASVPDR